MSVKNLRPWKIMKDSPNGTEEHSAHGNESEANRECDRLNARPANGYNVYRVEYRKSGWASDVA